MRGERFDEKQRLLQRMRLTAKEELRYSAAIGKVVCSGPGTMFAEDYRPPEPAAEKDGKQSGTGLQRPSQTLFEWRDGMQWSQKQDTRKVVLNGGVMMDLRSGIEIVLADKLNAPDWGKLKSGRKTRLDCSQLVANFVKSGSDAKPVGTAASKPAAEGRGDIAGKLNLELTSFDALGQVDLKDGSTRIVGHRLTYKRGAERDDASVEGTGVFPATLVFQAPDGRIVTERHTKIDIHFEDGRVVEFLANE